MNIKSIEVFNFRQFYGKQAIQLSGDDVQPVTVICGIDGLSTMDVYRAVLFCLFGEKLLAKDLGCATDDCMDGVEDSGFLNMLALQEDALGDRKGIETYVKTSFTHRGKEYEMMRAMRGIRRDDGNIIEQREALRLTITDSNGHTQSWGSEDHIEQEINSLCASHVMRYCLCDRERIVRLTGPAQKKDVQASIKDILGIEELDTAEEAIRILEKKLAYELSQLSAVNNQQKKQERREIQTCIGSLCEKQAHLEGILGCEYVALEQINRELEKYKDQMRLLRERKAKEEEQLRLTRHKELAILSLRQFLPTAGQLLARDLLAEIYQDIDEKRDKGYVPSEIKTALLEKILLEMTCICGRTVTLNSAEHKHLQQWLEASGEALSHDVMEVFGSISNTISFLNGKLEELFRLLHEVRSIDEDYHTVTSQLEHLNKALAALPDPEGFDRLYVQHSQIRDKINTHELELLQVAEELLAAESRAAKLDDELEQLSEQEAIYSELQENYSVAVKTRTVMGKIVESCINEIRKTLEQETNSNFRHLIDADGQKKQGKIVVQADHTLEVLDLGGRPVFADLSTAQQQVVALSFVIALAQLASGARVLELPLWLDFSSEGLTEEHRANLLQYLPQITPQCILLVNEPNFGSDAGCRLFTTGVKEYGV